MNRIKRISVMATITRATVVVGVGVAWSQIPDASGVIHTCYSRSGGALRVIDSEQMCGSKETSVDRAVAGRDVGPILFNRNGGRMDRHAATRRLHRLQEASGLKIARSF